MKASAAIDVRQSCVRDANKGELQDLPGEQGGVV